MRTEDDEERALLDGSRHRLLSAVNDSATLKKEQERAQKRKKQILNLIYFFIAAGTGVTIFSIPQLLPEHPAARRALGIFLYACIMWATEAVPLFVTSMSLPILITWGHVLLDSEGVPLTASNAAKEVMGQLFSGPVLEALGAFTMSLAVTKYQISHRLAILVLSFVGKRPAVVMLAVMGLAYFLSMWISNIAAPVVCIAVITPLLRSLPPDEIYIKVLLLGLAFGSNMGGITTPIASPQNIYSFSNVLPQTWNTTSGLKSGSVSWIGFLEVSIPYSFMCLIMTWAVLWVWYRPKLLEVDPVPHMELKPLTWKHAYLLGLCAVTVALWALNSVVISFTGDNGIVALIPVVGLFALGLLKPADVKDLSWDVLLLLAGGVALGDALRASELLDKVIANQIAHSLYHSPLWVVFVVFSCFIWLIANFVSHTVASITILPVIVSVGCQLGNGNCDAGHFRLLGVGGLFMCSCAMGLPVSSFPNIQTFALKDSFGIPYLKTSDFVKTGFLIGALGLGLLLSLQYFFMLAIGM